MAIEFKRALAESPGTAPKEAMLDAADATVASDVWRMLEYVPDNWHARQDPMAARRLAKLRHKIRPAVEIHGAEAFDTSILARLETYTTRLQYGKWVNRESRKLLQRALEQHVCTEQELYRALCSFGGLATRDGKLYAFPVGKRIKRSCIALISATIGIQLYCVAAFFTELLRERCHTCVLVGAAILFVIGLQIIAIIHETAIRRARAAKILLASGIPSFATRSTRRRLDFLQFLHRGSAPQNQGATV
jgi:hypothetical protein